MTQPRLILCSGATLDQAEEMPGDRKVISLDAIGTGGDVHIQIEDVAKVIAKHVHPRLVDLLEIASYVFTTDSAVSRGTGMHEDRVTENWERDLKFVIPVRDVLFWSQPTVVDALKKLLRFLSNDEYQFVFVPLKTDRSLQEYLEFSDLDEWPFYDVDRVVMFSGGLDSLAGAVQMASRGDRLVLVSHRSIAAVNMRQKALFARLANLASAPALHIPVWINKATRHYREFTQRSRSFLFASIGAVIAKSIRAKGIRFFENGIVSLNFPVADEVLRARASRTTHPISLKLLSELLSLVLEQEFAIDNPSIGMTKAEVVQVIADNGAQELVSQSCSCAHTVGKGGMRWHCGTCSQCIDRRIAIAAVGLEQFDPASDYVTDVFRGERSEGYPRSMGINYSRHVIELATMSPEQMAVTFNSEISRAIRYEANKAQAAAAIVDLHARHARTAVDVLNKELQSSASKMLVGELPASSMLGLIGSQRHRVPSWRQLSRRICEHLDYGLPRAVKTHKPQDEPHLQEICDGILASKSDDLAREFPFARWSSGTTKPDWSANTHELWVELKYVRKRSDIRVITEDIAADITKYGDSGQNILFVIFDPYHLIVDDTRFGSEMLSRPNIQVHMLR